MRVAFAGNPNSGKTTQFNALTGRNEKVGNWAGVTVGKKEGQFKVEYGEDNIAVDLPGANRCKGIITEAWMSCNRNCFK